MNGNNQGFKKYRYQDKDYHYADAANNPLTDFQSKSSNSPVINEWTGIAYDNIDTGDSDMYQIHKGNVPITNWNVRPSYTGVESYMKKHPGEPIYITPGYIDYHRNDGFEGSYILNPDLSNLDAYGAYSTRNPEFDQDGAMQDNSIPRTGIPARVNLTNENSVRNIKLTEKLLNDMFTDYESIINGDAYFKSCYGPHVRNDAELRRIVQRDAEILSNIRQQAHGDYGKMYELAVRSQLSAGGYEVLKRAIGNTGLARRGEDPAKRQELLTQRALNGIRDVNQFYDFDPNTPFRLPTVNFLANEVGDRYSDPYNQVRGDLKYKRSPYNYRTYNIDESQNSHYSPETPREPNSFSRGGRMSTPPKSFRVPGGYRVGRAEGLGNDEYDVYF